MSDPTGTIASPYAVLERASDRTVDYRRVSDLVLGLEVERIVVGLPVGLTGRLGPAAQEALDEVEALAELVAVPVEAYDERLTTVSAQRTLKAAGLDSRAQKRVVDKVAAAVMLQAWLDRRLQAVIGES